MLSAERPPNGRSHDPPDLGRAPLAIVWELTRAHADAGPRGRGAARPHRDLDELGTAEARELVDDLAGFGERPRLALAGGDPLMRRDVFEIAAHAAGAGLRVALAVAPTGLASRARMGEARAAGVQRAAIGLDGPTAALQDRFHASPGSFERTLAALEAAQEAGLPVEVETTVCTLNAKVLDRMVPLLCELGVVRWSVRFLVPSGGGRRPAMLSAAGHERLLAWLERSAAGLPFELEIAAAPQHRRIAIQRAGGRPVAGAATPGGGDWLRAGGDRPTAGVNDGRGLMFVSHRGEAMPSGALPLAAGSVRERGAVALYRDSPLFRELRDPAALGGRCGRCEFRGVCGGSRARAYAVSGDHLAEDPSCPYEPGSAGPLA